MSEEKTNFEKSLIMVAKELERLSRIRESRMEFEREMSSAPSGRPQPFKCSSSLPEASQNCDLELTCESDASYDVEEVRYQNFLARNRITSRSNVIKTLVYRVPESAYVVKRTQVYVDEPNEQKQDEKPADTTNPVSSDKKPQIKSSNISLNESQTKSVRICYREYSYKSFGLLHEIIRRKINNKRIKSHQQRTSKRKKT